MAERFQWVVMCVGTMAIAVPTAGVRDRVDDRLEAPVAQELVPLVQHDPRMPDRRRVELAFMWSCLARDRVHPGGARADLRLSAGPAGLAVLDQPTTEVRVIAADRFIEGDTDRAQEPQPPEDVKRVGAECERPSERVGQLDEIGVRRPRSTDVVGEGHLERHGLVGSRHDCAHESSLDRRDVPQGHGIAPRILGPVVRDDHLPQQHLRLKCSPHVETEWWTLWFG